MAQMELPPYLKNFYVVVSGVFLVWMLFFDANDLITQIKLTYRLREMEQEKKHYTKEVEKVKKERAELLGSDKMLEKFARERYLMKKEKEEIFVVVPTNEK
jgi:cell division protein DivIC